MYFDNMKAMILTLSDIKTNLTLLNALNPKFEKYFNHPDDLSVEDRIGLLPPLDGTANDFMRYLTYKNFLKYADYNVSCIEELKLLFQIIGSKQEVKIKDWVNRNEDLFMKELYDLHHELGLENSSGEHLCLHTTKECIVKKDWLAVITFFEVMWELYFTSANQETSNTGISNNSSITSVTAKIKLLLSDI